MRVECLHRIFVIQNNVIHEKVDESFVIANYDT